MRKTIPIKTAGEQSFIIASAITVLLFVMLINVTSAAVADGPLYITNSANNSVSVIDPVTNNITATINVGEIPFGVVTSPDGKKVYVVNYLSNNLSVIDTLTNNVTTTVNLGSLPFGITVSPDGKKLYVANFASNNISVINTTTNTVIAEIGPVNGPWGIALSPDGKKIYAASLNSKNISVFDTTTNTILTTVNVGDGPWGVTVSHDGKKAFVTNSNSSTVSVINTTTNTVEAVVNVGNGPWGIAVSPDGNNIYVANSDSNNVSVINTATNTVRATVNVGNLPCGITVNSQGTKVYVVNSDSNNVSVINTTTNTVSSTVNVGSLPVGIGQIIVPSSALFPAANFRSNVSSGYAPLTVQFIDLSENVTAWNWSFGDGTNSTQQNPIHTYSAAGNYTVNLTANNTNGSDSSSSYIIISKSLNTVVAAFSAFPTTGKAPLNVSFNDSSTGSPTSWKWYFGDGINSTERNPTHKYTIPGQYSVTLSVSNATSSNAMKKNGYIYVANSFETPLASFSASPNSGRPTLTVNFTDDSTGSPTSWKWYFGDGTNSTEQNPTHTYSNLGQYTVSLTAYNAAGSNAIVKYYYINVANYSEIPVTAFSVSSTSGKAPFNVNFTDMSTGLPVSWKWDFGDGANSTERNPTHTYINPGQYTVILGAKNAVGSNSLVKYNYINVVNPLDSPFADFSAFPTSGKAPLNVSFTDRSTGSPTSWKWSFGDGNISAEQNPLYIYSKAGKYTVNLSINNKGGSNTEIMSGYITVS